MTDAEFPSPEATDPEDVVWALQTAGTMYARGDVREAVRWLRRGAEAAGESGNDLRALALARRAADLAATHQVQPSVPPPPPASDADQTSRMAAAPPVSNPDNPALVPADDAEGGESDLTIPEGLSAVHRSSPHAAPSPRRSSPSAAPPLPSRSSPSAAPPPPSRRSAPAPSQPVASRPPPAPSQPAASAPKRSVPSAAPAGMQVRSRHAWRVAVEPAQDGSGSLSVRPLAEDEAVPDGMHEAMLTAVEPGAHLLSKKR